MCAWNPAQYERFRTEREQPFHDLLALLRTHEAGSTRVVDLGCGTGALTAVLHARLNARDTLGIDSSPQMLARARSLDVPGLRFEAADIETWRPRRRFDVVFSNAALQWLPDHRSLIPRIAELVAPGGQLAVQVPANFDHPSHTIADEVARHEPFATALGGYTREAPVLPAEAYATLLHDAGFGEQHVRLQVYPHLLECSDDVVEWVRGTLLTAYETRLPHHLYGEFVAAYRRRLLEVIGDRRPYFYAFKRILMWGRREAGSG